MKKILVAAASISLIAFAACQPEADSTKSENAASAEAASEPVASAIDVVLAAQPEATKARYVYRNPKETIEFFGIEPGMTVMEGLPGEGWYTRLLLPYLGDEGSLIGADYALDMFPLFEFFDDDFIEARKQWTTTFVADAAEWSGDASPSVTAFHLGSMPPELAGTADVVFFPRVLHNLARFEADGDYLTAALSDVYSALKPGGIFGVVQHQARDEMSDSFADGSHGYLKKSFVIAAVEQAGFEYVDETDINQNPADQPSEEDIVWRLPPSLATSRDNPELRAELEAIGESNRMTIKFRKPD